MTLKEYRIKNGFTQQQMGNKLNISQQMYVYYERQGENINRSTLDEFSAILGVKLSFPDATIGIKELHKQMQKLNDDMEYIKMQITELNRQLRKQKRGVLRP
jgi:transcriptional regulator with XRE-family HTH domain